MGSRIPSANLEMADNMRQGSNTFFNVLVIAFNVLAISAMFCAAKHFRSRQAV